MTNLAEKTQNNAKIAISYDYNAMAPNEYSDCYMGKMYWLNHREYSADTYEHSTKTQDFNNYHDFMEALSQELPKGSIIEPVYWYSHGGDTISRTPFHCRWDSWWVGVFVTTPTEAKRVRGWKRMSAKRWEIAKNDTENTFEAWKAYVEGEVYRVDVCDLDGDCEYSGTVYGENDLDKIMSSLIGDDIYMKAQDAGWKIDHSASLALAESLVKGGTAKEQAMTVLNAMRIELPNIECEHEYMFSL